MIVILQFDLPDKIAKKIARQDMHAEDILDQINREAVNFDALHGAWHFSDDAVPNINIALNSVFEVYGKWHPL